MAHHYAQGTLVWTLDEEEVWKEAEIVSAKSKEIELKFKGRPNEVIRADSPLHLRSADVFTEEGLASLNDLTQLAHLHEPAVLDSLQNRYDIDKIYTWTGPILIALNPFKEICGMYGDEVLRRFASKREEPHIFGTACAAYRGICDKSMSQVVLISGESGAGKTETTKHVLRFLALAGSATGETTNVERQVLESNPLLEAFGNARTLRNDNSSRFGKFIELQFRNQEGAKRLCGARIQTYLLEKVRIYDQQEGERNYHIFYEACAAADTLSWSSTYKFPAKLADKSLQPLSLDLEGFANAKKFAYLTRSTCHTLKAVDDVEMFERRLKAMQTIGISAADMQHIFALLAAVLNLGNVGFDQQISEGNEASSIAKGSQNNLKVACKMLGVEPSALEKAFCEASFVTPLDNAKIFKLVSAQEATRVRDSLAAAIYAMVFDFIVRKTNASIGYREDVTLFVGVLDIFGFECFATNSLEQMCINYTNERLQHFFIDFVFKVEEEVHMREGIAWEPLEFQDNQESLDLLQAKDVGIFALLDEECMVPKGSDQGFCNKLMRKYETHSRFVLLPRKNSWFGVQHFAGPVEYNSASFVEKNKDTLKVDILDCMVRSHKKFVADLFRNNPRFAETFQVELDDEDVDASAVQSHKVIKKQTMKRRYQSVSAEFQEQLGHLMAVVQATEPHFVRCVKPNPRSAADFYDRKSVTQQLRYSGVLQAVQVSRAGYPVRMGHLECWQEYQVLLPKTKAVFGYVFGNNDLSRIADVRKRAQKMLEYLDKEICLPRTATGAASWSVGNTLIFLKQEAAEGLKFARLQRIINGIVKIQCKWKRFFYLRRYRRLLASTRHVQALLRVRDARQELRRRRRTTEHGATVCIQSHTRGWLARMERRRRFAQRTDEALAMCLLRPSLPAGADAKPPRVRMQGRRDNVAAGLQVVHETHDKTSAVTCMCFGKDQRDHILMAMGNNDGDVVVYKVLRTVTEVGDKALVEKGTAIAVHKRMTGHSATITSLYFSEDQRQLVTTSTDKCVRIWLVSSGASVAVLTDSVPVFASAFLPSDPDVLIIANGKAVLRLANVQTGASLQKLKVKSIVQALELDHESPSLLAGTKSGSVYVLEATPPSDDEPNPLKFKCAVEVTQGMVTCITLVRKFYGARPCALVSACDHSITIIDCVYGTGVSGKVAPQSVMIDVVVRQRLQVPQSVLPIKNCFSAYNRGFIISGSEDNRIYIFPFSDSSNYTRLKHHEAPVVCVAVNSHDTLLASADSTGRIVLWRRPDFQAQT